MRNVSKNEGTAIENGWQSLGIKAAHRHMVCDVSIWFVALLIAGVLRYELALPTQLLPALLASGAAVALCHAIAGWAIGLYSGRYAYRSFEELRALLYVVVLVGAIASAGTIVFGPIWQVPRSIGLIATPIAVLAMCAIRYLGRVSEQRGLKRREDARSTIVYGAGYLGTTIIRRMISDPDSPYRPVALLDDDPAKANFQIRGINVLGGLPDLKEVAAKTGATDLIITIGHADAILVRSISDAAVEAGIRAMVLPPLEEVLAGKTKLSDLRDISIEDLIGRHPVDTEVESIAGYLAGKRVLVTGAGGSIGAELCKQLTKYAPSELIMLDRDETGLQGTQLGISGHGLLHTRDVVLADIRDLETLEKIFSERKPEVVFHAAALKHLPMLEQYPDEAWKTNVIGTLNVLKAARLADVQTFINISTDKAANPTSVLGHSKRMAEKLTSWAAEETGRPYLSVRFGNVIGSRGSMLPTFRTLIEAGGPLTVTHPDVTRFFMTIPEACQLVVQAGGIGRRGEVLILDMGEPVRILDIAHRMIEMSGRDIEIVFTGLREGEKMHEELIGEKESDSRPFHPKISHADVRSLSPSRLDKHGWEERMRVDSQSRQRKDLGLPLGDATQTTTAR